MHHVSSMCSDGVDEQISVSVSPEHHEPLAICCVTLGNHDALPELATVISKDIGFSGQFAVKVDNQGAKVFTKKELKGYGDTGAQLIIFLSGQAGKDSFEWRVYDALEGALIKGKKYNSSGDLVRGWGHAIADAIWPELTGSKSSFATKIAYCKKVTTSGKKDRVDVMIADYDGAYPQTVIATPTQHMAPRWNRDKDNPLLFYSEGTHVNIRLMYVSMQGKRKVASNFDGMNMLPSFSGDGSKVVYCTSKGHGNSQLYLYEHAQLKKLTHNNGNNLSPSLSSDGKTLFYCSDALTGKPQIYELDLGTNISTQITKGSFNFCPNYHQPSGKLVYTRLVEGQAQLFMYDHATRMHSQLTKDKGNKDECCWSECGSYILFSIQEGSGSRLALMNMHTLQRHYITPAGEECFYPSFSPLYTKFPTYASKK